MTLSRLKLILVFSLALYLAPRAPSIGEHVVAPRGRISSAPCSGTQKIGSAVCGPPPPSYRGDAGPYGPREPTQESRGRVCLEKSFLIWTAVLPHDRLRRSRPEGVCWPRRWDMREVYHVRGGVWGTGASRNMEPASPNERTNRGKRRKCPASQESPNWRTHRENAPGPQIKLS